MIIKESEVNIKRVIEILENKGIIIFPTDTVYGIGGDATSEEVLEKIYKIKERDRKKPIAVIMSDFEMIKEWCELNENDEKILKKYFPGPFTFILKMKEEKRFANNIEKVGIRIPDYSLIREIVKEFRKPIFASSANISNEKDATAVEEINKKIIDKVDLIIDGGKTKYGKSSTVIDLIEKKVLRFGAGNAEEFK